MIPVPPGFEHEFREIQKRTTRESQRRHAEEQERHARVQAALDKLHKLRGLVEAPPWTLTPRQAAQLAEAQAELEAARGWKAAREAFEEEYRREHGHSIEDEARYGIERTRLSNAAIAGSTGEVSSTRQIVEGLKTIAPGELRKAADRQAGHERTRTSDPVISAAIYAVVSDLIAKQSAQRRVRNAKGVMVRPSVKSFRGVVKNLQASGLVTCVFSATGGAPDRDNDVIEPGAFAKVMASGKLPPVVWGHSWDDISQVLGRVASWRELMPGDLQLPTAFLAAGKGGVQAQLQLSMNTSAGQTAYAHLENGVPLEYSFAFDVDDQVYDSGSGVRRLKSISEVFEVTLCLVGVQQLTATQGIG